MGRPGTYPDIEDPINHQRDVVLGDCCLVGDGDGHLLEGVNVGNPVHLLTGARVGIDSQLNGCAP